MWRDVKKIIRDNDVFLLATHINPDGDGIGSACALTELLIEMGKSVRFVCDNVIPRKFSFLDYHNTHEVYDPKSDYDDVQVIVVLDTSCEGRIGHVADILESSDAVCILVDHHDTGAVFTEHSVIDPDACSVGAMIYTLYKESGFDLNTRAASGIYTSIICDTGRFSYSSTSRKAHKIADECIKRGVDPDIMHSRLFQHVPLSHVKMFACALQGMETHLDSRVVIQKIYRKDCADDGIGDSQDFEYIHEFNKLIEGVECAVLLRELSNDMVRVSIRAQKDIGIDKLMSNIGGGGHKKAAGALWKGSIEDVRKWLLASLQECFCVQ